MTDVVRLASALDSWYLIRELNETARIWGGCRLSVAEVDEVRLVAKHVYEAPCEPDVRLQQHLL